MQKVTPFLWFDGNAEEAVKFYTSVFKKSKVGKILRWPEGGHAPKGSVLTIEFNIEGTDFTALNGGPEYKFNPAISFTVLCKTQKEVDYYWAKLLKGGKAVQCGWLRDKFGVSWQIVPDGLVDMFRVKNQKKAAAAMGAMMKMVKLDINVVRKAYKKA